MLNAGDHELVVLLATSSASLDASPKKNWVENAGGLPPYVRKLARAIMKTGKSKSQAISIAISRVKKWAAGGDGVNADTAAKAAKAVAQWEAAKAKNKSKKVVKASVDGQEYVFLSSSFNTETVRRAWEAQERIRRQAWEAANPRPRSGYAEDTPGTYYPYRWVRELWSDAIIVESDGGKDSANLRIPYTVSGEDVTFGEPTEVRQVWEEVADEDLDANESMLLSDILSAPASPLGQIIQLTHKG